MCFKEFSRSTKFKFSDFPCLKDATIDQPSAFRFARNSLLKLLGENLDPGSALRRITLTILDVHEAEEESSVEKLQDIILSEPYSTVQWEFKIMRSKIHLVEDVKTHVCREFSRVLGNRGGPRVRLSVTGKCSG